jgi:hypothetical protein
VAIVNVAQPNYTVVVNANNTFSFGPGWTGPSAPVSRFIIEAVASGWTGTATIKTRLAGNNGTFVPVPYYQLNSGGTVGTGPNATAVFTNVGFLVAVDASEQEVAVDITGFAAGTLTLTARLVQG